MSSKKRPHRLSLTISAPSTDTDPHPHPIATVAAPMTEPAQEEVLVRSHPQIYAPSPQSTSSYPAFMHAHMFPRAGGIQSPLSPSATPIDIVRKASPRPFSGVLTLGPHASSHHVPSRTGSPELLLPISHSPGSLAPFKGISPRSAAFSLPLAGRRASAPSPSPRSDAALPRPRSRSRPLREGGLNDRTAHAHDTVAISASPLSHSLSVTAPASPDAQSPLLSPASPAFLASPSTATPTSSVSSLTSLARVIVREAQVPTHQSRAAVARLAPLESEIRRTTVGLATLQLQQEREHMGEAQRERSEAGVSATSHAPPRAAPTLSVTLSADAFSDPLLSPHPRPPSPPALAPVPALVHVPLVLAPDAGDTDEHRRAVHDSRPASRTEAPTDALDALDESTRRRLDLLAKQARREEEEDKCGFTPVPAPTTATATATTAASPFLGDERPFIGPAYTAQLLMQFQRMNDRVAEDAPRLLFPGSFAGDADTGAKTDAMPASNAAPGGVAEDTAVAAVPAVANSRRASLLRRKSTTVDAMVAAEQASSSRLHRRRRSRRASTVTSSGTTVTSTPTDGDTAPPSTVVAVATPAASLHSVRTASPPLMHERSGPQPRQSLLSLLGLDPDALVPEDATARAQATGYVAKRGFIDLDSSAQYVQTLPTLLTAQPDPVAAAILGHTTAAVDSSLAPHAAPLHRLSTLSSAPPLDALPEPPPLSSLSARYAAVALQRPPTRALPRVSARNASHGPDTLSPVPMPSFAIAADEEDSLAMGAPASSLTREREVLAHSVAAVLRNYARERRTQEDEHERRVSEVRAQYSLLMEDRAAQQKALLQASVAAEASDGASENPGDTDAPPSPNASALLAGLPPPPCLATMLRTVPPLPPVATTTALLATAAQLAVQVLTTESDRGLGPSAYNTSDGADSDDLLLRTRPNFLFGETLTAVRLLPDTASGGSDDGRIASTPVHADARVMAAASVVDAPDSFEQASSETVAQEERDERERRLRLRAETVASNAKLALLWEHKRAQDEKARLQRERDMQQLAQSVTERELAESKQRRARGLALLRMGDPGAGGGQGASVLESLTAFLAVSQHDKLTADIDSGIPSLTLRSIVERETGAVESQALFAFERLHAHSLRRYLDALHDQTVMAETARWQTLRTQEEEHARLLQRRQEQVERDQRRREDKHGIYASANVPAASGRAFMEAVARGGEDVFADDIDVVDGEVVIRATGSDTNTDTGVAGGPGPGASPPAGSSPGKVLKPQIISLTRTSTRTRNTCAEISTSTTSPARNTTATGPARKRRQLVMSVQAPVPYPLQGNTLMDLPAVQRLRHLYSSHKSIAWRVDRLWRMLAAAALRQIELGEQSGASHTAAYADQRGTRSYSEVMLARLFLRDACVCRDTVQPLPPPLGRVANSSEDDAEALLRQVPMCVCGYMRITATLYEHMHALLAEILSVTSQSLMQSLSPPDGAAETQALLSTLTQTRMLQRTNPRAGVQGENTQAAVLSKTIQALTDALPLLSRSLPVLPIPDDARAKDWRSDVDRDPLPCPVRQRTVRAYVRSVRQGMLAELKKKARATAFSSTSSKVGRNDARSVATMHIPPPELDDTAYSEFSLSVAGLRQSLFELVDVWTVGIDLEEYIDFLDVLERRLRSLLRAREALVASAGVTEDERARERGQWDAMWDSLPSGDDEDDEDDEDYEDEDEDEDEDGGEMSEEMDSDGEVNNGQKREGAETRGTSRGASAPLKDGQTRKNAAYGRHNKRRRRHGGEVSVGRAYIVTDADAQDTPSGAGKGPGASATASERVLMQLDGSTAAIVDPHDASLVYSIDQQAQRIAVHTREGAFLGYYTSRRLQQMAGELSGADAVSGGESGDDLDLLTPRSKAEALRELLERLHAQQREDAEAGVLNESEGTPRHTRSSCMGKSVSANAATTVAGSGEGGASHGPFASASAANLSALSNRPVRHKGRVTAASSSNAEKVAQTRASTEGSAQDLPEVEQAELRHLRRQETRRRRRAAKQLQGWRAGSGLSALLAQVCGPQADGSLLQELHRIVLEAERVEERSLLPFPDRLSGARVRQDVKLPLSVVKALDDGMRERLLARVRQSWMGLHATAPPEDPADSAPYAMTADEAALRRRFAKHPTGETVRRAEQQTADNAAIMTAKEESERRERLTRLPADQRESHRRFWLRVLQEAARVSAPKVVCEGVDAESGALLPRAHSGSPEDSTNAKETELPAASDSPCSPAPGRRRRNSFSLLAKQLLADVPDDKGLSPASADNAAPASVVSAELPAGKLANVHLFPHLDFFARAAMALAAPELWEDAHALPSLEAFLCRAEVSRQRDDWVTVDTASDTVAATFRDVLVNPTAHQHLLRAPTAPTVDHAPERAQVTDNDLKAATSIATLKPHSPTVSAVSASTDSAPISPAGILHLPDAYLHAAGIRLQTPCDDMATPNTSVSTPPRVSASAPSAPVPQADVLPSTSERASSGEPLPIPSQDGSLAAALIGEPGYSRAASCDHALSVHTNAHSSASLPLLPSMSTPSLLHSADDIGRDTPDSSRVASPVRSAEDTAADASLLGLSSLGSPAAVDAALAALPVTGSLEALLADKGLGDDGVPVEEATEGWAGVDDDTMVQMANDPSLFVQLLQERAQAAARRLAKEQEEEAERARKQWMLDNARRHNGLYDRHLGMHGSHRTPLPMAAIQPRLAVQDAATVSGHEPSDPRAGANGSSLRAMDAGARSGASDTGDDDLPQWLTAAPAPALPAPLTVLRINPSLYPSILVSLAAVVTGLFAKLPQAITVLKEHAPAPIRAKLPANATPFPVLTPTPSSRTTSLPLARFTAPKLSTQLQRLKRAWAQRGWTRVERRARHQRYLADEEGMFDVDDLHRARASRRRQRQERSTNNSRPGTSHTALPSCARSRAGPTGKAPSPTPPRSDSATLPTQRKASFSLSDEAGGIMRLDTSVPLLPVPKLNPARAFTSTSVPPVDANVMPAATRRRRARGRATGGVFGASVSELAVLITATCVYWERRFASALVSHVTEAVLNASLGFPIADNLARRRGSLLYRRDSIFGSGDTPSLVSSSLAGRRDSIGTGRRDSLGGRRSSLGGGAVTVGTCDWDGVVYRHASSAATSPRANSLSADALSGPHTDTPPPVSPRTSTAPPPNTQLVCGVWVRSPPVPTSNAVFVDTLEEKIGKTSLHLAPLEVAMLASFCRRGSKPAAADAIATPRSLLTPSAAATPSGPDGVVAASTPLASPLQPPPQPPVHLGTTPSASASFRALAHSGAMPRLNTPLPIPNLVSTNVSATPLPLHTALPVPLSLPRDPTAALTGRLPPPSGASGKVFTFGMGALAVPPSSADAVTSSSGSPLTPNAHRSTLTTQNWSLGGASSPAPRLTDYTLAATPVADVTRSLSASPSSGDLPVALGLPSSWPVYAPLARKLSLALHDLHSVLMLRASLHGDAVLKGALSHALAFSLSSTVQAAHKAVVACGRLLVALCGRARAVVVAHSRQINKQRYQATQTALAPLLQHVVGMALGSEGKTGEEATSGRISDKKPVSLRPSAVDISKRMSIFGRVPTPLPNRSQHITAPLGTAAASQEAVINDGTPRLTPIEEHSELPPLPSEVRDRARSAAGALPGTAAETLSRRSSHVRMPEEGSRSSSPLIRPSPSPTRPRGRVAEGPHEKQSSLIRSLSLPLDGDQKKQLVTYMEGWTRALATADNMVNAITNTVLKAHPLFTLTPMLFFSSVVEAVAKAQPGRAPGSTMVSPQNTPSRAPGGRRRTALDSTSLSRAASEREAEDISSLRRPPSLAPLALSDSPREPPRLLAVHAHGAQSPPPSFTGHVLSALAETPAHLSRTGDDMFGGGHSVRVDQLSTATVPQELPSGSQHGSAHVQPLTSFDMTQDGFMRYTHGVSAGCANDLCPADTLAAPLYAPSALTMPGFHAIRDGVNDVASSKGLHKRTLQHIVEHRGLLPVPQLSELAAAGMLAATVDTPSSSDTHTSVAQQHTGGTQTAPVSARTSAVRAALARFPSHKPFPPDAPPPSAVPVTGRLHRGLTTRRHRRGSGSSSQLAAISAASAPPRAVAVQWQKPSVQGPRRRLSMQALPLFGKVNEGDGRDDTEARAPPHASSKVVRPVLCDVDAVGSVATQGGQLSLSLSGAGARHKGVLGVALTRARHPAQVPSIATGREYTLTAYEHHTYPYPTADAPGNQALAHHAFEFVGGDAWTSNLRVLDRNDEGVGRTLNRLLQTGEVDRRIEQGATATANAAAVPTSSSRGVLALDNRVGVLLLPCGQAPRDPHPHGKSQKKPAKYSYAHPLPGEEPVPEPALASRSLTATASSHRASTANTDASSMRMAPVSDSSGPRFAGSLTSWLAKDASSAVSNTDSSDVSQIGSSPLRSLCSAGADSLPPLREPPTSMHGRATSARLSFSHRPATRQQHLRSHTASATSLSRHSLLAAGVGVISLGKAPYQSFSGQASPSHTMALHASTSEGMLSSPPARVSPPSSLLLPRIRDKTAYEITEPTASVAVGRQNTRVMRGKAIKDWETVAFHDGKLSVALVNRLHEDKLML